MGAVLFYLWPAVVGACIGSFLNVVVYRLPKGAFWSKARSFCPSCERTLRWTELVPVFSYLFLRGRCKTCRARISPRYPAVEALCAALAVACLLRFGPDWRALVAFGVCAVLLAIALIDHDTMEIPDALVIALVPFAVGAIWLWPEVTLLPRGIGLVTISVPMLVLALVIEGAFGGGDIKLMAVCGVLLGWQGVLLAFLLALVPAGSAAIVLLATKKKERKAQIAFGPYLCAGVAVSLFYGGDIIHWYLGLFL